MPHGDLTYFWLSLADAEKAKGFYGELLGWRYSPGNAPEGWNIEGTSPPGGLHGGASEPSRDDQGYEFCVWAVDRAA
jgi:predicted enzyme related to lactoylglutathione lyase